MSFIASAIYGNTAHFGKDCRRDLVALLVLIVDIHLFGVENVSFGSGEVPVTKERSLRSEHFLCFQHCSGVI